MQDILDAMLQCQSMWMYLEPIFSSEDIIAQMPENGRKFAIVDSYWKNIVAEAVCVIVISCITVSTTNDQQQLMIRFSKKQDVHIHVKCFNS